MLLPKIEVFAVIGSSFVGRGAYADFDWESGFRLVSLVLDIFDWFDMVEKKVGVVIGAASVCAYLCCCACMLLIAILLGVLLSRRDVYPLSTIVVDGKTRYYILRLPKDYRNTTAGYPLLVGLHGGFGNARQYERDNGFEALQAKSQFIGVYPFGWDVNGRLSILAWNSGNIESASWSAGISDSNFINQLVNQVKQDYSVDSNRVSCTGHSNGGMMCYRLAGEHSETFKSIAVVSGTIGGQFNKDKPEVVIPRPLNNVALAAFHGELDVNVRYNGGLSDGPGSTRQGGRYDISVAISVDFFRSHNNCSDAYVDTFSSLGNIRHRKWTCAIKPTWLYTFPKRGHGFDEMNGDVVTDEYNGKTLAELIWWTLTQFHQ